MCVYSKTTIYICEELRIIHVYKIHPQQKPYSDILTDVHLIGMINQGYSDKHEFYLDLSI